MVKQNTNNKNDITTIKVSRVNRNKINYLKDYLGCRDFDGVIGGLLYIVSKFKLKQDLKNELLKNN
jgi:hypothetical protein